MGFAREQVFKGIVGLNRICELCGISKNTYYDSKDPQDRLSEKYVKVKKYVERVITKHSSYGIRRIKVALKREHAIDIGRDVLAKLLVLWGLSMKRKVWRRKLSMIQKILLYLQDKTNLLARSKIDRPLQAVTSDMSELVYDFGNSKCYVSVHKDAFGQVVYGHDVSEHMEVELEFISKSMQGDQEAVRKNTKDDVVASGSRESVYELCVCECGLVGWKNIVLGTGYAN